MKMTAWRTHIFRIFVEAGLDELLECLGVVARELRRVVLWNEEEHAHGVHVRVGRLPLGQLYGRDAQRPDVRLGVVGRLLYHLGRHPERRAHERVALVRRVGQLSGYTEVGQFHVPGGAQENIGGCGGRSDGQTDRFNFEALGQ